MKAYIVIEWNGESYEDSDFTNVAVYLNESKAMNHINEFNKRIQPNPLPKNKWKKQYTNQSYADYLEDFEHDWIYNEKDKKQHVQEIEITE
jgi:hypothetical protein